MMESPRFGKLGSGHGNLPLTPPLVALSIPADHGHRPGTKVLSQ
jgi:hypothetical protein